MEFSNARRERFFSPEDDDQEEPYKQLHPFAPSSSSSTSSAAARWAESSSGPADATGPSPGLPVVEREHMFDKVVTPSDVGKLNRLVIPKQHAEKYFPLDAASNEKGLLLSFEDRTGKPWRFRYSYWNSSQSYVMTKGWSRFVKEKRLDAGDTVSFGRGVGETGRDRLFIDWKRRPEAREPPGIPRLPLPITGHQSVAPFGRSLAPWSCDRMYLPPPATTLYDHHHHHHHQHRQGYAYNAASPSTSGAGQYLFFRSAAGFPQTPVQLGPGGDRTVGPHMVLDSVPVAHGKAAPKRVRLFGVNLDCPESDGGGDGGTPSQAVVSLVPNTTPPRLHLRLGAVDSIMSSPREQQPSSSSPLDLDM